MSQVATTCLARGVFAAAGYATWQSCPAGYTWILKHLSVTNPTLASANFQLQAVATGMSAAAVITNLDVLASSSQVAEFWVALNAGDSFNLYSSAAGVRFWLSGSQLLGDSPWSPASPILVKNQPSF